MESQGHRAVPVWVYHGRFRGAGQLRLTFAGPALSHLRDRVGTDDGGIAWSSSGSSIGYMFGSFLGGRVPRPRPRAPDVGGLHGIAVAGRHRLISQIRELAPLVAAFVAARSGLRRRRRGSATPWWCGAGRSHPAQPSTPCTCSSPSARSDVAVADEPGDCLERLAVADRRCRWPLLTIVCCGHAVDDAGADEDSSRCRSSRGGDGAASVRRGQLASSACSSSSTSRSKSVSPTGSTRTWNRSATAAPTRPRA